MRHLFIGYMPGTCGRITAMVVAFTSRQLPMTITGTHHRQTIPPQEARAQIVPLQKCEFELLVGVQSEIFGAKIDFRQTNLSWGPLTPILWSQMGSANMEEISLPHVGTLRNISGACQHGGNLSSPCWHAQQHFWCVPTWGAPC